MLLSPVLSILTFLLPSYRLAADGRVIRSKCFNHDSVSKDMSARRGRGTEKLKFFSPSKGVDRHGAHGPLDSLVRSVGLEALCDISFDGPSTATCRISGSLVLRRLRSHHYLLKD